MLLVPVDTVEHIAYCMFDAECIKTTDDHLRCLIRPVLITFATYTAQRLKEV